MKKVILSIIFMALAGAANASPLVLIFSGAVNASPISAGYLMAKNEAVTDACYSEPVRSVSWKSNPSYSFSVAGCDYQAKKSQYILS